MRLLASTHKTAFLNSFVPNATKVSTSAPLIFQLAGQGAVPIKAVSATEFEAAAVGARVVFHPAGEVVDKLVIHQSGRELPFERVAGK